MNRKLKVALKRRSSGQGFALPVALGMGLIMVLVGTTMILRSQDDQVIALAQKATADSLAIAETGVTRVQTILKKYPALVTENATNWNDTDHTNVTTCSGGTATTGSNETTEERKLINRSRLAQWLSVDDADPLVGEFRVVSYSYDTATRLGTLNLEGRARSENASTTATSSTATTVGNSTTSLQVQIPNQPLAGIPGIWVKGTSSPLNLSTNNSVQANVRTVGCTYDVSWPNPGAASDNKFRNLLDGTRPTASASTLNFPPLPSLPTTGPAGALGATTPSGQYFLPSLNISNCYIVLPRVTRTIGATTGTNCTNTAPSSNGNTAAGLSPGAGQPLSSVFNITSDLPGADGVYRYLIDSDSSPTGVSLSMSSSQLIINPSPGQKVVLYVRGNISLSGTSTGGTPTTCVPYSGSSGTVYTYINSGSPSNLEIYGADGSRYGGSFLTNAVNVSGNTVLHGFIYAPNVRVDLSQAELRGAVWSHDIATSNSSGCAIGVAQESVGNNLSVTLPSSIGPVQSWHRQQAN